MQHIKILYNFVPVFRLRDQLKRNKKKFIYRLNRKKMKKLVLFAVALVAISFASCKKTAPEAPAATDSVAATVDSAATDSSAAVVDSAATDSSAAQ